MEEFNAHFIVAAANTCLKINPHNPTVVINSIPEMVELIKAIKAYQKDGLNRWDWIQGKIDKIASDLELED